MILYLINPVVFAYIVPQLAVENDLISLSFGHLIIGSYSIVVECSFVSPVTFLGVRTSIALYRVSDDGFELMICQLLRKEKWELRVKIFLYYEAMRCWKSQTDIERQN